MSGLSLDTASQRGTLKSYVRPLGENSMTDWLNNDISNVPKPLRPEHCTASPTCPKQWRCCLQAVAAVAVNDGDFSAFDKLLTVLSRPYEDQPAHRLYAEPPRPEQVVRQTFCGT